MIMMKTVTLWSLKKPAFARQCLMLPRNFSNCLRQRIPLQPAKGGVCGMYMDWFSCNGKLTSSLLQFRYHHDCQQTCGEKDTRLIRKSVEDHDFHIDTQFGAKSNEYQKLKWKLNWKIYVGLFTGISLVSYLNHDLELDAKKRAISGYFSALLAPFKACFSVVFADESKDSGCRSSYDQFNFIADVVDRTAPAVVYIEVQARVPPFMREKVAVANGSGFIVRDDGLILTNAHVVANKSEVLVRLFDSRQLRGVVQSVDPVADLATIKIDAKDLPVLKLGNSKQLRPGEFVIALGSPLSLSNTVTAGIVSSTSRGSEELGISGKDMSYIQTDAQITHGNSGGPLVNLKGEAIGINTMKVTSGISFAIPADYATAFLTKASASGGNMFGGPKVVESARRRYIGVSTMTITPSLVEDLRLRIQGFPDVTQGILIHRVVVGSPAYNAGLRPGDVVTHIDDKVAHTSNQLHSAVRGSDQLECRVLRDGRSIVLTVRPEDVE